VRVLEARCEADLAYEALRAEKMGQLRLQHLEGNRSVVAKVVGEVNRCHAAAPELAVDAVAVAERRAETLLKVVGRA
jgi:hypothetical protein